MRILFITSNAFFPEHYSGQNRTLLELCCKLVELNHEPVIVSGKSSALGETAVIADHVYGFPLFRCIDPVKSLTTICTTLRPDIAVVVDGSIEWLITQFNTLNVPLAAWLFHIESHSFRQNAPKQDLLYIVTSSFLARRLSGLFSIDAEIIAPYIEQKNYQKPRQGKRVLFVNPVRENGVEIAFQLAQHRPDHFFIFVESWGISREWKAYCFDKALKCGNIEWVSHVYDFNALLDQTQLLLIPRFTEEGFSRLVTEAQLGGIPALSSDRGYLTQNVGQGGSVLSVDCALADWLEELDRYLDDDEYYSKKSEQAKLHALRDEVSSSQVVEDLLRVFKQQISQASPTDKCSL